MVSRVSERTILVGLALFVILILSILTVKSNSSALVKDRQDTMENQIDQVTKYRSSLSASEKEISELSNDKLFTQDSQTFSSPQVKPENDHHHDTSTQKTPKSLMNGFDGIFVDENGIPYVDYDALSSQYAGIGKQRNPVTTIHYAMAFYNDYKNTGNEISKMFFINNVNWLVDNTIQMNGFSTFEYMFDWPVYNMHKPWRSAMANAGALTPLVLAHEMTGNVVYLNTAKQLLNSLFVEIKDGGLTYRDFKNSWWYEYGVANNNDWQVNRVLNGMLFALLDIYSYYMYTHDPDAKLLFDNGVNSVKENLYKYDAGDGKSYYDIYQRPAPSKYHEYHIETLDMLYKITGEKIFKEYSEKWSQNNKMPTVINVREPDTCESPPWYIYICHF